jgi:hypothetical protein
MCAFYTQGMSMPHPLADILAHHPTLTTVGFESGADPAEEEAIALRRRELLANGDSFAAACAWIRRHLRPHLRSRRYFSSSALKHIAAREIGPVSNGLFIAAMLHCGHRFLRQDERNPNAYFPLSTRRVVALDRRRVR